MSEEIFERAMQAAVDAWPTDSEFVPHWHPEDAALHRRNDWRSFTERRDAVLRQRQERVVRAILAALNG